MGVDLLPKGFREQFEVEERNHACAILHADFPNELQDILNAMKEFRLLRSEIAAPGGGKSEIARRFEDHLGERGWQRDHRIDTAISVGEETTRRPTHEIDFHRNRVAVEIEWNSKDLSFMRDLAVFRALHESGAISVGVLATRHTNLGRVLKEVPEAKKYSSSTTHMRKLMECVDRHVHGTCPLLIIGIGGGSYVDDRVADGESET
jgi:hypothetical protein